MNSYPEISQETIELIEGYLLGQMPEAEKKVFEERLKSDDVLQQHVEEMRLMVIAIQEKSLRQDLSFFHEGISAASNHPINLSTHRLPQTAGQGAVVKTMTWKKWLSAAAVLLILASSAWWLFLKPGRDQQMFAEYFQPDPGLMTTMGGTEEYEFNRAMIDYKSAHYDSAISRWTKLLNTNKASDTLNYFIASAYLANKNFSAALRSFQPVLQQQSSAFFAEANWYAGLAALKTGDKVQAAKYLSQSARPEKEKLLAELNQ